MDFNEYQCQAKKTINPELADAELIESGVFGLMTEVGKLSALINTERFKGVDCVEENIDEIIDISGDLQWYANLIMTALNVPMEEAVRRNLVKTQRIYGTLCDKDCAECKKE